MNYIKGMVAAIWNMHWVHKGEMATHLTYLSATFLGAHGGRVYGSRCVGIDPDYWDGGEPCG